MYWGEGSHHARNGEGERVRNAGGMGGFPAYLGQIWPIFFDLQVLLFISPLLIITTRPPLLFLLYITKAREERVGHQLWPPVVHVCTCSHPLLSSLAPLAYLHPWSSILIVVHPSSPICCWHAYTLLWNWTWTTMRYLVCSRQPAHSILLFAFFFLSSFFVLLPSFVSLFILSLIIIIGIQYSPEINKY